jgi:hypothetical protein
MCVRTRRHARSIDSAPEPAAKEIASVPRTGRERNRIGVADDARRNEDGGAIRQTEIQERPVHMRSAFDQQSNDVALTQYLENLRQVDPPSMPGHRNQFDAWALQSLVPCGVGAVSMKDQHAGARLAASIENGCGGRCSQVSVEHDPDWVSPLDVADGELRVVGKHGPHPDQNRVAFIAHPVGFGSGLLPGDPFRVAGAGGDLSIERHGRLQGNER